MTKPKTIFVRAEDLAKGDQLIDPPWEIAEVIKPSRELPGTNKVQVFFTQHGGTQLIQINQLIEIRKNRG